MVFVVQETKHNVWKAQQFGSLQAVFPVNQRFFGDTEEVIEAAHQCLAGFDDDDFLLLTGDPVAIGIATSIAAKMNGGKYKVLVWDRFREMYHPAQINLNGEQN